MHPARSKSCRALWRYWKVLAAFALKQHVLDWTTAAAVGQVAVMDTRRRGHISDTGLREYGNAGGICGHGTASHSLNRLMEGGDLRQRP